MPTGGGPHAYRPAFEVMGRRPVSMEEVEEARKLFWRRTAIHRGDRPTSPDYGAPDSYSGGSFLPPRPQQKRRPPRTEEFACGIYALEMREARQKAFTRSQSGIPTADDAYARHLAGSPVVPAGEDNGSTPGYGLWQQGALPICRDEWDARGHDVETVPKRLILSPEDRGLAARVLAKSPGRNRGRPPSNGLWSMTNTERSRRHRAKEPAE